MNGIACKQPLSWAESRHFTTHPIGHKGGGVKDIADSILLGLVAVAVAIVLHGCLTA